MPSELHLANSWLFLTVPSELLYSELLAPRLTVPSELPYSELLV